LPVGVGFGFTVWMLTFVLALALGTSRLSIPAVWGILCYALGLVLGVTAGRRYLRMGHRA